MSWLAAFRARPVPLASSRWLVVDVETTGLDPRRDRLLAIGAVRVDQGGLSPAQSFDVVLRQDAASGADNILVHRIGHAEQLAGMLPADSLAAFRAFAGDRPCVGFHAGFDRAVLRRAGRAHDIDFDAPFLDLALLAPALTRQRMLDDTLDGWLVHFGIAIAERHRAISDAWGTAQLFQVLLARAGEAGVRDTAALMRLAKSARWLGLPRPG